MNIKLLIISAAAVALIGSVELFAQAQQSSGGRPTCMWDMPHDQCMKMMKDCGMGPGMMMRWSMMGSLQVDSNDPAALLALKTELSLTADQQEKLAAIQKEAQEKAKAILTETQQAQVKPLLETPNTMMGMCQQWHAKMNKRSGSGTGCCW